MQSVSHKAVLTSLTGSPDEKWQQDESKAPAQIRVSVAHDTATISINTSGPALHQRGRREDTGEAPLKEHIAAALVLMTSRGYSSPLVDPFCGSGTLLIEAAMIASNTAPGLQRSFAYQNFPCFAGTNIYEVAQKDAQQKVFDKPYTLLGYDNDSEVLERAKLNAKRAGVGKYISFSCKDSLENTYDSEDTIITNPPYGKRIGHDTVHNIHLHLFDKASSVKNMTIITGYESGGELVDRSPLSRKEIICLNGADDCGILIRE